MSQIRHYFNLFQEIYQPLLLQARGTLIIMLYRYLLSEPFTLENLTVRTFTDPLQHLQLVVIDKTTHFYTAFLEVFQYEIVYIF